MQTAQEKQGGQPVWKRLFLGVAVALGTLALVPSTALAQEESTTESDNTLEEVIVTANYRKSTLMNAVGSISVVGRATISERAAQHLEEVLNAVPNVT